jgi:hypothetical protein
MRYGDHILVSVHAYISHVTWDPNQVSGILDQYPRKSPTIGGMDNI